VNHDGTVIVRLNDSAEHPARSQVLKPGASGAATLIAYWFNWCGSAPGPLQLEIKLAHDGGSLNAPFNEPDYVPRCTAPGHPSTLQVIDAYDPGS
jgi:hypothetical protein